MKYCELKSAEKNELKETLWEESLRHSGYTYDYLGEEQKATVDGCDSWEDIPDEIVENAYGVYNFVPEDFFCNVCADCVEEVEVNR